jgi:CrcB protein
VLGSGFVGAFTTFSTFSVESVRLAETAEWRALGIYLAATLAGGLAAAGVGLWLASIV